MNFGEVAQKTTPQAQYENLYLQKSDFRAIRRLKCVHRKEIARQTDTDNLLQGFKI